MDADHIFADILLNHEFLVEDATEKYYTDNTVGAPSASEETQLMMGREQTLTYFHVKDFRNLIHGHGLQRSMNRDDMTRMTQTMAQNMTMEEINMARETMRTSLQTFHSTTNSPAATAAPRTQKTHLHLPPPPPPCHALFLDAPSPIILDSLQRPSSSTENLPLDCLDGIDQSLDLDVPSTSDALFIPFDLTFNDA